MIGAWPVFQVLWSMHNVLHTIEHHRSCSTNVEQAFDAQDIFTPRMEQHAQPDAEGNPVQRLRKGQRQGARFRSMMAVEL